MDVDTAMLVTDWDELICNLFEDYDVFGVPYEPIGGFSSGDGKIQTYKNFPNAVWVALKEGLPWGDVSWWPAKESNVLINTEELSDVYSLPKGYQVVRDVGCELPVYCYNKGYKSMSFAYVNPSSSASRVIATDNDYSEEFQYDGVAIVGHQRGSCRNPFRETELSSGFYNAVEKSVGVPS